MMKVSVIGSFRKYYEEIRHFVTLLKKNQIEVLSPQGSDITDSIDDFVVFSSDNRTLTPAEIQLNTLVKILTSDAVYVYDPNGYIGRTTCYEIGVIRTKNVPLFFKEPPKDLPIVVQEHEIVPPTKFIHTLSNVKQSIFVKNEVKNVIRLKKVVICGSMSFYDKMSEVSEVLQNRGVSTIIPKEENMEKDHLSTVQFNTFKRKVSNQYLAKIRKGSTHSILVLNQKKRGLPNYIGANTLVEISMAFCWGRPIYLYNNFYEPLRDELMAWNAICLNGNLELLISSYRQEVNGTTKNSLNNHQLEFGDVDEYFYPLFR